MTQPESYPRRVVKGTSILFIGAIAALAIGFLLRAFLARSFSVENYGLFFAVFAFFSLLGMFPNLGLNTTVVKYVPEFLAKKRFGMLKSSITLVVIIQASIAGIISLGLLLFSNQIALAVFGTEAATDIIRVLCFWFFAWVFLFLLRCVFAGFQNMLLHSLLEVLYISIVFSSVVVLVGFLGLGFGSVPSAYLIGSGIAAVVAFVLLIKKYSWAFKEKILINKQLSKRLFKFALPVFLSVMAGIAILNVDTLIITIFLTLEKVGYYQIARPVARVLWYFPLALGTVLLPMVSELWAKKR